MGAKHNVIPLFVLIPSSQSAAVSSTNSALSAWNRRYWFVVVVASVEVAGDDGAEREREPVCQSRNAIAEREVRKGGIILIDT